MRKKIISIVAIVTLCVSIFTGCGAAKTTEEETTPAPEATEFPMTTPADGFKVMIVGSGSPQYEVDRGQPSTLVQYKDKYFLIDCGNGTVNTLVENGIYPKMINNVFLTHQHFDHNAEFWDVFMGGSVMPGGRKTLTLVGPDVGILFNTTITYYKDDIDQRIEGLGLTNNAAIYDSTIMDITENTTFELDGVKISTFWLDHGLTNYAYKFEADGQTVVVTGDFRDSAGLAEFAQGADIFVIDGMLTSTFDYNPNEDVRTMLKTKLLNSHEAAEAVNAMVAATEAKKTVYTHLGGSSGIEDTKASLEKLGYEGEVIAAEDGLIIEP